MYNGGRPRSETKVKSAIQLQDLLDATRMLVPRSRPYRESDSEAGDIEHAEKLGQVKAVLEEFDLEKGMMDYYLYAKEDSRCQRRDPTVGNIVAGAVCIHFSSKFFLNSV